MYVGCRCVSNPPPYFLCIRTIISHIYGYCNLIVLQTAPRELTGRTVKKTADIAKTMNNVILGMDAVTAVVRPGLRQMFATHT